MTDSEWRAGWGRLIAAFDRDLSPEREAVRTRVYREQLDGLPFYAWRYAVREALHRCKVFPAIASLLEYADDATPPGPTLPAARRTPEELESAREATRRGLQTVREELERHGFKVEPLPKWPA